MDLIHLENIKKIRVRVNSDPDPDNAFNRINPVLIWIQIRAFSHFTRLKEKIIQMYFLTMLLDLTARLQEKLSE